MILIRCSIVKSSTEHTGEETIKEVMVSDFCPWSDPEKLEELLKDLLFLAKKSAGEEEIEIAPPVNLGETNTSSVASAAKRLGITTQQYHISRQKFLRSYNFTRKESLRRRTIKWLKTRVHSLVK